jgi:hypothetical protein
VQFDHFFKYRIKVARELIGDARAPHASAPAISADHIKTLVNRTRMKVVNIALTKVMKKFLRQRGPSS